MQKENNRAVLPAGTSVGPVALITPNTDNSLNFYQGVLGLEPYQAGSKIVLRPVGAGDPIVMLEERPDAQQPPARSAGLFHMAIRVPTREALAGILVRLVENRWRLQGASDHGVSEALYLADPDGNGMEIYADRPQERWPMRDGSLEMVTLPLDVEELVREGKRLAEEGLSLPAGTELGHVHLKVTSIPPAEHFYTTILGFELMQRYGSQASFVSAGGYHHHIAFNVWQSAGGMVNEPGTMGLEYFVVCLPSPEARKGVLSRLEEENVPYRQVDNGWLTQDPSGNGVLISDGGTELA